MARLDELALINQQLAAQIEDSRGSVIINGVFAYYLGKRAVWVKRVWKQLYLDGGTSVFRIPHESSYKHSGHRDTKQLSQYCHDE